MLRIILSNAKKISSFLILSFICILGYNYTLTPKTFGQSSTQKEIIIIVPSYNNKDWYQKNLDSLVHQQYNNYHIIYIDDCSSDGTGDLVQSYISQHQLASKITLVKNPQRVGALENLYTTIHATPDDAIIVTVDGDDWLKHDHVLTTINQAYQNPDTWMTYGQFEFYPSQRKGVCKSIPSSVIENNIYRKSEWYSTHLRTFYSWLFKSIKKEDFLYNQKFIQVTWDMAFMFPMLEMAAEKHSFITDVLYVYNEGNNLCDHAVRRQEQIEMDHIIRARRPYDRLAQADCLIFSFDRPLQLYALLESMHKYVSGCSALSVLYRASTPEFHASYERLKNDFKHVHFIQQSNQPRQDFKELMLNAIYDKNSHNYILFAVDDIVVKDYVDLRRCIAMMQHENAYGFYLRLGKNISKYDEEMMRSDVVLTQISSDVYSWIFKESPTEWHYANTVDMTLYNKQTIRDALLRMDYWAPNSFEGSWAMHIDESQKGLCFETSKIINIPINKVQTENNNRSMNLHTAQELLAKFNEGFKIDILPLHKLANKYPHTQYKPAFVMR